DWLPQSPPYYIGLWAAVNGIAALVLVGLAYYLYSKQRGADLRSNGVLPGWKAFGKSVLLGAIVVAAAFGLVFFVDYVFKTDFRVWVVTVKAFTVDKVWLALRYLPLFLVYFVANSIALNSFNRFTIAGREWVNTAVLALANSIAPIVLVIAQYWHFFSSGYTFDWFPGITSIWLFPVIVFLAVAAVISRKIYDATGNPYVAGFINAAVVTMIAVSNTLTMS
ncbi:MAG: alpha/beta hydrolase, partial [Acidimicrobiia bacterium]|nr:alpha/beta hydrolase [Acidimicrobiia bacterium]